MGPPTKKRKIAVVESSSDGGLIRSGFRQRGGKMACDTTVLTTQQES